MRRLGSLLLDHLFPPRCGFCGTPGPVVCPGCLSDLPHNRVACPGCARPLAVAGHCGVCQSRPPPFARVVAPMRYAYPVDAAIRAFKFRYVESRLPSLSALMLLGIP
ncbi:MAG: double zinc ribbon domain-containing protein, partial [Pseudomonadota bacterium]